MIVTIAPHRNIEKKIAAHTGMESRSQTVQ
jgi:hypothetical protein